MSDKTHAEDRRTGIKIALGLLFVTVGALVAFSTIGAAFVTEDVEVEDDTDEIVVDVEFSSDTAGSVDVDVFDADTDATDPDPINSTTFDYEPGNHDDNEALNSTTFDPVEGNYSVEITGDETAVSQSWVDVESSSSPIVGGDEIAGIPTKFVVVGLVVLGLVAAVRSDII